MKDPDYFKNYYINNKEKYKYNISGKKYYNDNKDKIKAYTFKYNRIKIKCSKCDCMINKSHLNRHLSTSKHINNIGSTVNKYIDSVNKPVILGEKTRESVMWEYSYINF